MCGYRIKWIVSAMLWMWGVGWTRRYLVTMSETPKGGTQRPTRTSGPWNCERHQQDSMDGIRLISLCGLTRRSASTLNSQTKSQPTKRCGVCAKGRKHQRPATKCCRPSDVHMGALVEAGGGYRVKPFVMHPKPPQRQRIEMCGRTRRSVHTRIC